MVSNPAIHPALSPQKSRFPMMPNLVKSEDDWAKLMYLGECCGFSTKEKLEIVFDFWPEVLEWLKAKKLTHPQLGCLVHRVREEITKALGEMQILS